MNSAIILCVSAAIYFLIFFLYKKQPKSSLDSLLLESNGIFKQDKVGGITCLFSGILLIGLFIIIGFKDSESTLILVLLGIGIGIVFSLLGVCFLLFNYKAFFYIDNEHIKGKYHYFGKIDCSIQDVIFALGRNRTLIIQLNDGKTHTIMGIENAWHLASTIRRNMTFDVAEQPEALIEKLNNLKSSKKKGLIYVCSGLALMFINIFITVFLTSGREILEFSKTDLLVFAIMGAIEIATVIATFYYAQKTGKNNIPIEKLQYTIRRRIIETRPLLPGNVIKVFADENYTGRLILYGYPNQNSFYYTVQEFASDYSFFKSYESETYDSIEHLQTGFESLIDITEIVLH